MSIRESVAEPHILARQHRCRLQFSKIHSTDHVVVQKFQNAFNSAWHADLRKESNGHTMNVKWPNGPVEGEQMEALKGV